MLTDEQKQLYERLRADNDAAGFPFTPENHWRNVNGIFQDWFEEHGIGDVIDQPFNDHFAGLPHTHLEVQAAWCEWMTEQYGEHEFTDIRELYSALLEESCDLHIMMALWRKCEPHELPWDLLTACEAVTFINRYVKMLFARRRVVDLGGGWGRMGVALRFFNRGIAYIDCDLPESLLIASEYLPSILEEDPSLPVGEFDLSRPGMYFIPAYKFEQIPDGSLDLVINMASFQEMPQNQIDAYCEIISRKADYFYSMQVDARLSMPGMAETFGWDLLACERTMWGKRYAQALFKVR